MEVGNRWSSAKLWPAMLISVLACLAGLAVLVRGADEFVKGAVRLSAGFNVSPVVVGAVVLGFGTSAPELVVSSIAASGGNPAAGVGNAVGSNIANLTLVLGATALVAVLKSSRQVTHQQGPLALGATIAFAIAIFDGELTRLEGLLLLFGLFAALTLVLVLESKSESEEVPLEMEELLTEDFQAGRETGRTLIGLLATVASAWLLVWGAERIADEFGLSGGFVGFTLFALGTSLPELVTSMAAARQGETDLILGNLFGSNLFNNLAVGAAVALLGPGVIDSDRVTGPGAILMVAITALVLVALFAAGRLVKWQGLVLLAIYLASLAVTFERTEEDEAALAPNPATTATDFNQTIRNVGSVAR